MAKRKRAGRRFVAEAAITNLDLTRAKSSIRIKVFDRGAKLGEVEIGRGSMMWFGSNRKTGTRIRWPNVAKMFNEFAYGE